MTKFFLFLFSLAPVDYVPSVAVEGAYALIDKQEPEVNECCGLCKNGVITHGDGHKTPCPCPPECKCKQKK